MKTTIVKGGSQPTKEIDWSERQVLVSKDGSDTVLCTGAFDLSTFCGVIINNNGLYIAGHYSSAWTKQKFTPLTEPITITFEND